jgi:CHRD domain
MSIKLVGAAMALSLFAVGAAHAATLNFSATLNGASETPPTASKGTGDMVGTLDTVTKTFSYKVNFAGLTGPATMAHFHGPAAVGVKAGVALSLGMNPTSPITGTKVLTDAQVSDLEAGLWYVNVHTAANPGGEIRGQVTPKK